MAVAKLKKESETETGATTAQRVIVPIHVNLLCRMRIDGREYMVRLPAEKSVKIIIDEDGRLLKRKVKDDPIKTEDRLATVRRIAGLMSAIKEEFYLTYDKIGTTHCSYSSFSVFAALLWRNLDEDAGILHVSYGINREGPAWDSQHAEQNALAVAARLCPADKLFIVAVVVAGFDSQPIYPCGICRQYLIGLNKPLPYETLIFATTSEFKVVEVESLERLLRKHFPSKPQNMRLLIKGN